MMPYQPDKRVKLAKMLYHFLRNLGSKVTLEEVRVITCYLLWLMNRTRKSGVIEELLIDELVDLIIDFDYAISKVLDFEARSDWWGE
ncbi:MAG TPA: hypothetical protein ENF75_02655 [Acidilobales archaeon]|nr:hypothetical protein [Acidilobales archaeon]